MRTALICKTAPKPFVDAADVKRQLKIAATDASKDELLEMYIGAVCGFLDGADGSLKRAVAQQAWALVLPSFHPHGRYAPYRIELPLPPIRSVTSIRYYDANGSEQTLAEDAWRLVNRGSERSRVVPINGWPAAQCREDAVSIEFVAGYGEEDGQVGMPTQIKQAVILMIKQLYDMGQRSVFVTTDTVFGVGSKQYAVSSAASDVMQRAVGNLLFNVRLTG